MHRIKSLTIAVSAASALAAGAAAQTHDAHREEVVVTGVRSDAPLHLSTNPRNPRQPLPAHDGADYLKTIPGFSVIRKGGTDGDPVLRGMAGSRISMLIDGELILGGCNARMDPPTAYVFPETFDSIKVIKGPQTVQYGPGNSAGVVLFEKDDTRPETSGWQMHSSVLAGSFGRHDEVMDLRYFSPAWEARVSGSNASASDYEDGDGVRVHSRYQRWNGQLSLAWTPDDQSRYEFSTARSDGEAAYADRGVDGSKFARENYSFKYTRDDMSGLLSELELQTYYNDVDHVMDNYSLRRPSGMSATAMAMNPGRTTMGGKAVFTLVPSAGLEITTGLDFQRNEHSSRNTMNQASMPIEGMERVDDGRFDQAGLFGELSFAMGEDARLITGLRVDRWKFTDQRADIALGMMSKVSNPTSGEAREDILRSGFVRLEDAIGETGLTWYAGVGHNERFPDYWEITKESATALSSTQSLRAEKNTQLDTGLLFKHERVEGSVSVFYSGVRDYIMIQNGVAKAAGVMGAPGMGGMPPAAAAGREATIARNIDARSWGVELDGQYHLADNWHAQLSLSSVRGANDSDGTTLAQLPPLEARLGIHYDNQRWSAGLLWRSLAAQTRVDIGKGNIVGQDFGPTGSAEILSFNAGWRAPRGLLITAGIDNLLNETYAEHISRAGDAVPGFEQLTRINEPGRVLWMKASYAF